MNNAERQAQASGHLDEFREAVDRAKKSREQRALFAAMAMQGILSRSNTNWARMEVQLAEQSVRHADALIAELSK